MSRTKPFICCSRCGRIIYKPLTARDLHEKGFAKHISDYYVVNEDGKEYERCPSCYMVWKGSEE